MITSAMVGAQQRRLPRTAYTGYSMLPRHEWTQLTKQEQKAQIISNIAWKAQSKADKARLGLCFGLLSFLQGRRGKLVDESGAAYSDKQQARKEPRASTALAQRHRRISQLFSLPPIAPRRHTHNAVQFGFQTASPARCPQPLGPGHSRPRCSRIGLIRL